MKKLEISRKYFSALRVVFLGTTFSIKGNSLRISFCSKLFPFTKNLYYRLN